MFEALVLLVLVTAVVAASRRWPDVEKRLFPDEVMKRPGEESSSETVQPAEPPPVTTPTAKGFMQTKPIASEPDVDPVALQRDTAPSAPIKETVTLEDTVEVESPSGETVRETVTEKVTIEEPAVPDRPGGLVTGTPARPSEPAYFDATRGSEENVEDLMAEADKAYRDRDFVRAERASLKIVVLQPKNHKYMTRLGQVYKETGALEDARDAFAEAKKLDPKNFFVLNQLAEVERLISDKGGRSKAAKHKK